MIVYANVNLSCLLQMRLQDPFCMTEISITSILLEKQRSLTFSICHLYQV
jgi:hypothetical protein